MYNLKFKIIFVVLLAVGATFVACGDKSGKSTQSEQAAEQGKEYTSAYICPMHCDGSGSDAEGKCPVCGMDYVQNKDHKADEHDHDDHDGHSH